MPHVLGTVACLACALAVQEGSSLRSIKVFRPRTGFAPPILEALACVADCGATYTLQMGQSLTLPSCLQWMAACVQVLRCGLCSPGMACSIFLYMRQSRPATRWLCVLCLPALRCVVLWPLVARSVQASTMGLAGRARLQGGMVHWAAAIDGGLGLASSIHSCRL